MNKKMKITPSNISKVEARLKNSFSYFHCWCNDCECEKIKLSKEAKKNKVWQRWFLSHQSYLNWHLGVCGFMQYVKCAWIEQTLITEEKHELSCIPCLHSNASNLESFFSLIRSHSCNTPLKYPAAVGTLDETKQMIALERNPMHEPECGDSYSPSRSLDMVLNRSTDSRRNTVNEWHEKNVKFKPRSILSTSNGLAVSSNCSGRSKTVSGTCIAMTRLILESDQYYCNYITSIPDFVSIAMLSIGTGLETYFKNLITLDRKREAKHFQNACKAICDRIIKGTKGFCECKGSINRSFMALSHKLQISDNFMTEVVNLLPTCLQVYPPNASHCLLVDWVGKWFQEEFIRVLKTEVKGMLPACSSHDVKEQSTNEDLERKSVS